MHELQFNITISNSTQS